VCVWLCVYVCVCACVCVRVRDNRLVIGSPLRARWRTCPNPLHSGSGIHSCKPSVPGAFRGMPACPSPPHPSAPTGPGPLPHLGKQGRKHAPHAPPYPRAKVVEDQLWLVLRGAAVPLQHRRVHSAMSLYGLPGITRRAHHAFPLACRPAIHVSCIPASHVEGRRRMQSGQHLRPDSSPRL